MIGATKILTVSYGTFSCTLEGFDEPFSTMKAIAEYFRDLAAEDRYFGAVPPTPDAEMLHRIAEREVRRRVEARVDEHGIVLRQAEAPAEPVPVSPVAAPAQTPAAAPAEAPAAAAPQPAPAVVPFPSAVPPQAPAPAFAPAFSDDESIAAKLARIRAVVAQARTAAPVFADEDDEGYDTTGFEATSAPDDDFGFELDMADSFVAAAAPEAAVGEPEVDEPAAVVEAVAEAAVAPEALEEPVGASVEPADGAPEGVSDDDLTVLARIQAIEDEVAETPAAYDEDEDRAQGDEEDFGTEDFGAMDAAEIERAEIDLALAPEAAAEPREWTEDEALADEVTESAAEPAEAMADAEESVGGAETVLVASEAATDDAGDREMAGWDEAAAADDAGEDEPAAAEFESDEAADAAEADAELTAILAGVPDLAETPDAEETAAVEETAGTEAGIDHAAEAPSQDEAPALTAETDRLGVLVLEHPIFAATASPEAEAEVATAEGEPEEAGDEDAALLAGIGAAVGATVDPVAEDLVRELAQAEEEAARDAEEKARAREARERLAEQSEDDASVERLMDEAKTKLEGAESRRRFSAISHLKAAVAATVADRLLRPKDTPAEVHGEPEEGLDRYREDLSKAVRPRRPSAEGSATTRRPTFDLSRPAPLVLVSEQRIDDQGAKPAAAVRPRRVTMGALALRDVQDDGDDEDFDDTPISPEEARSFAEFADRLGASGLADLLEAAAAYTATVEGQPHFTRPDILRKVAKVTDEGAYSREDSLRSFGMLLRQGTITKVSRGQFALTGSSRFMSEARSAMR
ncbi:MAG: hypothetical protein ACOY5U_12995 [Pseudomonadota bacterium]